MLIVKKDRDLENSVLPGWYGVAYREFYMRRTVLAVIPFNLAVRYAVKLYRHIYRWVKYDEWQEQIRVAYSRGYNDGNITKDRQFEALIRAMMGKSPPGGGRIQEK